MKNLLRAIELAAIGPFCPCCSFELPHKWTCYINLWINRISWDMIDEYREGIKVSMKMFKY